MKILEKQSFSDGLFSSLDIKRVRAEALKCTSLQKSWQIVLIYKRIILIM